MATFTGTAKLSINGALTSAIDIGTLTHNINYAKTYSIADGTGADQANMLFVDTRTVALSSSENLDLAGGLTDAFGATITFTKIKGIIIAAAAANTNNVLVGGHATAAFVNFVSDATDVLVVRPGGTIALFANDVTGYAVVATTGDLLKITNSGAGTGVTYDIILIGAV